MKCDLILLHVREVEPAVRVNIVVQEAVLLQTDGFCQKDNKVGQFVKIYGFYLEGFYCQNIIIINLLLGIIIINVNIIIIIVKPILLVEEVRHNVIVRLHQRGLVAHSEVIVP